MAQKVGVKGIVSVRVGTAVQPAARGGVDGIHLQGKVGGIGQGGLPVGYGNEGLLRDGLAVKQTVALTDDEDHHKDQAKEKPRYQSGQQ